jgi:hypothetical protein
LLSRDDEFYQLNGFLRGFWQPEHVLLQAWVLEQVLEQILLQAWVLEQVLEQILQQAWVLEQVLEQILQQA